MKQSQSQRIAPRPSYKTLMLVFLVLATGCDGGGNDNSDDQPSTPTPTPTAQNATPVPTPPPSTRAWAVGAVSLDGGVIIRSEDEGRNWAVLTSAPQFLSGIHFIDQQRGWAVGPGEILHTTDGGTSWIVQRQVAGEHLGDVIFLSPERGVVVGSQPLTPPNFSGPALVLLTTDAGTQWTPVPLPDGPVFERAHLGFVCFTSTGTGITFGEGTSGGVFLLSEDAGASWMDISDRIGGAGLTGGACVGETDLWVVGFGPRLFHSSNGGLTWTDRSAPIREIFQGELHGIAFTDPTTAWAVGARHVGTQVTTAAPIVIHTTDGASTWQEQALPLTSDEAVLFAVDFTSEPLLGIAVGENLVPGDPTFPLGFATLDGTTWTAASFPAGVGFLFDVTLVP